MNSEDFIGQERIVRRLRQLYEGAQRQGQVPPHTLIVGRPGAGKSTLSLRVKTLPRIGAFHHVHCTRRMREAEMVRLLVSLDPGDVLYLDELQELRREAAMVLLPALEEGKLPGARTPGESSPMTMMYLAEFSVLAATSRPSELRLELRERFEPCLELEPYSLDQIQTILVRRGRSSFDLDLTPAAARLMAGVCKFTPRRAIQHLKHMAFIATDGEVDEAFAREYLRDSGIDPESGLTALEQRYLVALLVRGNRPALTNTMRTLLGVHLEHLKEELDAHLVALDLVEIGRGRVLTPRGQVLAQRFAPQHEAQPAGQESSS
jgi:Holliday junction DNA helicase RuvB